jgi:response regulator RpfG family c-di-GMP phosphodiesterase
MVLLDVQMPGPDGFEICRRLKTSRSHCAGAGGAGDRARGPGQPVCEASRPGLTDFLSKPVQREELLARVSTLRRLHDNRKELEGRRLAAEVQEKEAIRKTFSRYLSPRLAERVLAQSPRRRRRISANLRRALRWCAVRRPARISRASRDGAGVEHRADAESSFFTVLTGRRTRTRARCSAWRATSMLVGFNVPVPQPDARSER